MRHDVQELNINTNNATAGYAVNVGRVFEAAVQVHGSFAGASLKVQAKIEDPEATHSDWVDLATVTTPTVVAIPSAYNWLRIFTTTYAGTPKATFGGLDTRSDG